MSTSDDVNMCTVITSQ